MNYTIRTATERDSEALLSIYSYYAEHTAVTFEYTTPTAAEFRERIEDISRKYPFILAERDGKILGYAYAGAFNPRAAYDRSVETTVYVDKNERRSGVGAALYGVLEKILALQGILNMNACIAFTENEDEFLTRDSVYFHKRLGFTEAGRFHKCGYKFERWYDVIWMEKLIAPHTDAPAPIKDAKSVCTDAIFNEI